MPRRILVIKGGCGFDSHAAFFFLPTYLSTNNNNSFNNHLLSNEYLTSKHKLKPNQTQRILPVLRDITTIFERPPPAWPLPIGSTKTIISHQAIPQFARPVIFCFRRSHPTILLRLRIYKPKKTCLPQLHQGDTVTVEVPQCRMLLPHHRIPRTPRTRITSTSRHTLETLNRKQKRIEQDRLRNLQHLREPPAEITNLLKTLRIRMLRRADRNRNLGTKIDPRMS